MSTTNKVIVRVLALVAFPLASLMFALVLADTLGVVSVEATASPNDPAPSPEARAGAASPNEPVHAMGALGVLIVVASGLLQLVARPERAGAAFQVLAVSVGMLAATAVVGNPDNYGGQAGTVDPAFLALAIPAILASLAARPWRWTSPEGVPVGLLLAFAAIAALPAAFYGVEQGLIQRNTFPPAADPHHQAHWYAMSVAAFSTVLSVAGAAAARSGWRVSATSGALVAILVAGASIVSSASASSLHPVWSSAVLLWAVALLVVVWRRRHAGSSPST